MKEFLRLANILTKLQARKLIVSRALSACEVCTVLLKDEGRATDLEYAEKQQLLTVVKR